SARATLAARGRRERHPRRTGRCYSVAVRAPVARLSVRLTVTIGAANRLSNNLRAATRARLIPIEARDALHCLVGIRFPPGTLANVVPGCAECAWSRSPSGLTLKVNGRTGQGAGYAARATLTVLHALWRRAAARRPAHDHRRAG